jgi:hypothetical protein
MKTAARSTLVPDGPHGDLIREITGTETPRRSSTRISRRSDWTGPGFLFTGPAGECTVLMTGRGRVFIEYGTDEDPQSAEFELKWERIA